MPKIVGVIYDEVYDVSDLEEEVVGFFGVDSLYKPQQVDNVRFVKARKGDNTIMTHNSVPLFDDKSDCRQQIMVLNVGYDVEILDLDEECYKVRPRTWKNETICYVKIKFVAL